MVVVGRDNENARKIPTGSQKSKLKRIVVGRDNENARKIPTGSQKIKLRGEAVW